MASPNMKLRASRASTQEAEAQLSRMAIASRSEEGLLIRQAQEGRWEAFAELASHYDSLVLALILRLTSSEREARELFQMAFTRAYRELRSYRFQCSFYLWIYRMVARTCMQFLQQKGGKSKLQRTPMEEAMVQLSPRERMVVELKHSLGLKLETIAAILETSETMTRNTFVRAMWMLRISHE
ncbi:MAG TPA: sigma-70 family RNA polymerase sigma factor [Candidatus Angelobacter sp.]